MDTILSITWNTQGDKMALIGHNSLSPHIQVWDLQHPSDKPLLDFQIGSVVVAVAFSPDAAGSSLAGADLNHVVHVWDTATGQEKFTLVGHQDGVVDVKWSPDGQTIATASKDRTVRLWNVASHQLITTLVGHKDYVNAVAWSPDGTKLASAGLDGEIRIWDAVHQTLITTFMSPAGHIWNISWSSDGQRLATANEVWDVQHGTVLFPLKPGYQDGLGAVAWSPDGTKIATTNGRSLESALTSANPASKNTEVRLFDATTGTLLHRFEGSSQVQNAVIWNHAGDQLASAGRDKMIHFWQLCNLPSVPTATSTTQPTQTPTFVPTVNKPNGTYTPTFVPVTSTVKP